MLGSKALRTCSVCRDKLRTSRINGVLQVAGPSSSRTLNTTPKHDYLAESKSIGTDIDDSVFASHPLTNPDSNHGHRRISATRASEEGQGLEDGGEEWIPREERRSPAAVFGSKRVGLETVPRRMEENIQSEINSMFASVFLLYAPLSLFRLLGGQQWRIQMLIYSRGRRIKRRSKSSWTLEIPPSAPSDAPDSILALSPFERS